MWIVRAPCGHLAHDIPMTSRFRPLLVPGARLYRLSATRALLSTHPAKTIRLKPGTFELLRLLNGTRDVPRLQQLVQREVPEFQGHVMDELAPLIQLGVVLPFRPTPVRLTIPQIASDGPADTFATRLSNALTQELKRGFNTRTQPSPTWHIIISTGEPSRQVFDQFIIESITHLPIVLEADTVHIGPLTVPTFSPCLNCYDEQRTRTEPRWHALTTQFGIGHVECGVSAALQYRAISELLHIFEANGGDSLIGSRLSLAPEADPKFSQFGFGQNCHCHLLAA